MVNRKVIQQFHSWIYSKKPSLELKQAFVHQYCGGLDENGPYKLPNMMAIVSNPMQL